LTGRLFVYGTLLPTEHAWPVLARWATGEPVDDAVAGALYDTGRGYPAATFGGPGSGLVHGAVVTLDRNRAGAALAALDRYEASEYERVVVRTVTGIDVVTYAWVAPLAGCAPIPSGRWPVGS
jgi:gamma-glutamylcyclotransferase (GGCT)/AIG2-like uncharacterized protein YtfP